MLADGFNKNIYHQLTTLKITLGLSLKVFKVFVKKQFPFQGN